MELSWLSLVFLSAFVNRDDNLDVCWCCWESFLRFLVDGLSTAAVSESNGRSNMTSSPSELASVAPVYSTRSKPTAVIGHTRHQLRETCLRRCSTREVSCLQLFVVGAKKVKNLERAKNCNFLTASCTFSTEEIW